MLGAGRARKTVVVGSVLGLRHPLDPLVMMGARSCASWNAQIVIAVKWPPSLMDAGVVLTSAPVFLGDSPVARQMTTVMSGVMSVGHHRVLAVVIVYQPVTTGVTDRGFEAAPFW